MSLPNLKPKIFNNIIVMSMGHRVAMYRVATPLYPWCNNINYKINYGITKNFPTYSDVIGIDVVWIRMTEDYWMMNMYLSS